MFLPVASTSDIILTMSKRTIRCQMAPTQPMIEALDRTCEAFAWACNAILERALAEGISNNVKLHRLVYRTIREDYGLSANLVVRAIRRVSAAIHAAKRRQRTPKQFRPTSIDYDARIFDYRERDETVSLTTMGGRLHIPLLLGGYQREALRGKKPTAATVVKHGNRWDIHIVVEDPDAEARSGPPMGVDLGIRNTAATSHGTLHDGSTRQAFKEQRMKIRASLQSKGTRGAKRLLKRLSGYEIRRIRWENHNLSKHLVAEALANGNGAIHFEKLTNIRQRTKVKNRHLNRMVAGWSFGQLQDFTAYKARRAGLRVDWKNPYRTSQDCSRCGQPGLRQGDTFTCTACGTMDADYNAACNLAGGAEVTQPEFTQPPASVESSLLERGEPLPALSI
jgi:putative transposase